MPTYSPVFYDISPSGLGDTTPGGLTPYTGPVPAGGTAVITDDEAGIQGLSLDDDRGGETATAGLTIGANSSTGARAKAERAGTAACGWPQQCQMSASQDPKALGIGGSRLPHSKIFHTILRLN